MKRPAVAHHVVVVRAGVWAELSCICGWAHRQFVGDARTPTSRQAFDMHVSAAAGRAS